METSMTHIRASAMLDRTEELQLARAARIGDQGAFERLVRAHLPLAVVRRELVKCGRSAAVDAEVLVGAGAELLREREVTAPVGLGVRVHVDRGEGSDVEAGDIWLWHIDDLGLLGLELGELGRGDA